MKKTGEMQHYKVCPLCGSRDISSKLTCTDHLVTGEHFDIFTCESCEGAFTMGHPLPGDAARYYKSDNYISHTDASRNIFEKAYQIARKFMLTRKRRLVEKTCGKISGSVLDIGCGTGHFVNEMKLAGWKSYGIEINEGARNYGRAKFSIDVSAPEEISSFEQGKFDAITLWHVLEHFDNPASWMKEIGRILKPGGSVFIALPNRDSADCQYYKESWAAWDVPRHIWHFNPASFRKFALTNAYNVIAERGMPADIFYISVLSEKIKGSKYPFLKGLFRAALISVKSVASVEKSSSVIYVLGKSDL